VGDIIVVMRGQNLNIHKSKDVLGGVPVFEGTRVPVQTLVDYLEAGDRIDDFLDDFPTVKKDQVVNLLEIFKKSLLESDETAA
jgi:uncharacterized protein (DUF433 family)